jgi:hypothetical protein
MALTLTLTLKAKALIVPLPYYLLIYLNGFASRDSAPCAMRYQYRCVNGNGIPMPVT